MEPILPPAMIVVIGAGHVGKAVVHLAKWLGFRVAVSDDRAEFCTPEFDTGSGCVLSRRNGQVDRASQNQQADLYRHHQPRFGRGRAGFARHAQLERRVYRRNRVEAPVADNGQGAKGKGRGG